MGDDQETVRGFLNGEPEAVRTVDLWISRAAWPYQRRLAHRWDDVLQDVRLEVTRLLGQGKFRGESSLRTYLWRVVSHTCLDQLRTQDKWQWADLETVDQEDRRAPGARVPERNREDKDLLLRVLARMSQECRELWRMVLEGFSYKEMSLRLQVAEGTLRVRVLRCRERAVAARDELLGHADVTSRAQSRLKGAERRNSDEL
jgi:RNA polymerase sigma factor (sigma-70 family)